MGNLSHTWFELKTNQIQLVDPPQKGGGSRTSLKENDLLISITGDIGWKGLIPPDFGEAYINQHTALIRFISHLRSHFFPIILCSPFSKRQFDKPQRGIKNSFRLSDLDSHITPLPPLAEQRAIVVRIEKLLGMLDELEAQSKARKEQSDMLLQAVLREAFGSI